MLFNSATKIVYYYGNPVAIPVEHKFVFTVEYGYVYSSEFEPTMVDGKWYTKYLDTHTVGNFDVLDVDFSKNSLFKYY